MELFVGTSGYSYKPWKGKFYPEKLKDAEMLRFYAQHFRTVEINNTFYRMPAASLLSRWSGETSDAFRFVLKAPQRITHHKRLAAVDDDVRFFLETSAVLGEKRGPLLFQLPPYLKMDASLLGAFLLLLPPGTRAAFEFRHQSWFTEEVYTLLRRHGAALCLADVDEDERPLDEIVSTADWGYLRLRRAEYGAEDLASWQTRIRAQPWQQAYVFFKHEDEGKGPAFAEQFVSLSSG
ncbi:MAG: DUF72 domain-containing protein, partial [bacterium]